MLLKQPAQVFVPGTPGQAYVPEQHVCTPTDAPPGSEAPGNWVMSCYEEYRPIASAGTGQYSYGTHGVVLEIDRTLGTVEFLDYIIVEDCGRMVNPMIVAGQAHGGVVQAIGQALMERTVFDAEGQFLTGTYTDYAMPRADNAPMFSVHERPTRATTNPLGAKGCGEAGCAGGLPAIMNALVDALSPYGVTHLNMPATPETIWRIVNG